MFFQVQLQQSLRKTISEIQLNKCKKEIIGFSLNRINPLKPSVPSKGYLFERRKRLIRKDFLELNVSVDNSVFKC